MQLYFSPELIKPETQILNVVDQNDKAVGYVNFLIDEKKIYVYGYLEESGVQKDFEDIVKPYIQGMKKANKDLDIYSYLSVGGEKIDLENQQNSQ